MDESLTSPQTGVIVTNLPTGGLVSDTDFLCFASIFLARTAPRSWNDRLVLSFDDVALPALCFEKLSLPW